MLRVLIKIPDSLGKEEAIWLEPTFEARHQKRKSRRGTHRASQLAQYQRQAKALPAAYSRIQLISSNQRSSFACAALEYTDMVAQPRWAQAPKAARVQYYCSILSARA